jgi:hypothetical protein
MLRIRRNVRDHLEFMAGWRRTGFEARLAAGWLGAERGTLGLDCYKNMTIAVKL